MASPSPAAKTERLLNLVICLLYTRQPLSKARIRDAVPQYGEAASDEAFDRMFERDKDELRELGIPLRMEPIDAFFDDETGYRIDRREYALPELSFEPDEFAVLGLASRTWQQASLAGAAATALRKLEAAEVERDANSVVGLEPRIHTTEPAFNTVKDAVLRRQAISFGYRKAGGEAGQRRLQPWNVANWHGRWYVTGFDLDREAPRVFRLGRIDGAVKRVGKPGAYDVPPDHDPIEMIDGPETPPEEAVVLVQKGAGNTLRRRARGAAPEGDLTRLTLAYTDTGALADEIAGFGPAVQVVSPPRLVDAVVRRLRGALDRNGAA
ncbi:helix-turn-helix transcriptional regulator [Flexivirga oryzae]|uniref:Proteasome accessory factor B n=1 Tax=Flexivirga oryzae TaxID=1794944 RepID=A0A839N1K0_9MICO|nr:WYL domain-containing protein [Flexivirga oryzae]MBB2891630.1 proteasome accessory factor B [Flexivirga oryzae]